MEKLSSVFKVCESFGKCQGSTREVGFCFQGIHSLEKYDSPQMSKFNISVSNLRIGQKELVYTEISVPGFLWVRKYA